MPLDYSGSKQAFSDNVSAEVHAGKPQKQAVAIAYSVKRNGAKRRKSSVKADVKQHMDKLKRGLRT